eukprot:CAMPEP_0182448836 /NCGR_PEP_ID=MMETSP1172-20130603/30153_1 /TAXON_ID=708627 /ORGANISM="Timspurckia oligopyrenoides, Strain CCMP3278" /LENGTH=280 /DNA_ID=CAMNT_0024645861 /DNA_START=116 /DNA_END=955 /DNA_ORIENTATION=+
MSMNNVTETGVTVTHLQQHENSRRVRFVVTPENSPSLQMNFNSREYPVQSRFRTLREEERKMKIHLLDSPPDEPLNRSKRYLSIQLAAQLSALNLESSSSPEIPPVTHLQKPYVMNQHVKSSFRTEELMRTEDIENKNRTQNENISKNMAMIVYEPPLSAKIEDFQKTLDRDGISVKINRDLVGSIGCNNRIRASSAHLQRNSNGRNAVERAWERVTRQYTGSWTLQDQNEQENKDSEEDRNSLEENRYTEMETEDTVQAWKDSFALVQYVPPENINTFM